jgi:ribosomal protein S27AE
VEREGAAMTKQYCDRCGAEITGKKSAAVSGVNDADTDGNGVVTEHADLCTRCYRAVWKFIGITPQRRLRR